MLLRIEVAYQLYRNRNRTILLVCIAALLICCMSLYIGNIQSAQAALEDLGEAIPVHAQIVSRDGTNTVGLEIREDHVDSLLNMDIKDPVYTSFACGSIDTKSCVDEKAAAVDTNISGANDLRALVGLTEDNLTFLDGWDGSFLASEDAVCIINNQYAMQHDLILGDTITMPLFTSKRKNDGYSIQLDRIGEYSIQVIGIYQQSTSAGATPLQMVVPIKWLKNVTIKSGQRFLYDSFRCTLANPMELNTFKEAAKASHFSKVVRNTGMMIMENSYKGDALVVDDQLFIETAEKLQQNSDVLRLFMIPFFSLVILMITLVTFQILRSAQRDMAIAISLGRSRRMSAFSYFLSTILADFTGSVIAFIMLATISALSVSQILIIIGLFMICAVVGVCLALLMLLRFDTLILLTKVD